MSGQRNWNDMSSDEDEDSWFDSDEEQGVKKVEQPPHEKTEVKPAAQQKKEEAISTTANSTNKPTEQKENQPEQEQPKKEATEQRKFLSNEDLLLQYTNKTVDDPCVIKAVKVFNEEHKTLLKSIKNARAREVKEGMFIIYFDQPEGVIEFIKDKIANRYRFFLQPYFKRKEEEGRQERKDRNDDKRKERQRRPKYQDEKQDEEKRTRKEKQPRQPKEIRQRQPKEPRQHKRADKQEEKAKKVYVPKEFYEIQSNKNILIIRSQSFDIDKVIEDLQEKKIFKNFNKLRIKTPFEYIAKVSKLISQISTKFKFNLDKQPAVDTKKEEVVELTLIQNVAVKSTKALAQKYQEEKAQPKPKETKPHPPPPAAKGEQVVHARKLASNYDDYFSNISIYNLSQIVKGFDENQYVKRLKENSATIFEKNWNSWKIEAEDQNIEALLKLTHRLKKSTLYDVDLKPSMRSLKPILTAELKPRPEKDRRPKVDVSGVNGYLS